MSESKKVKLYLIFEPNVHTTYIHSTTPSGAAKKVYSKYIRPKLNQVDESKKFIVKIQNENGKLFEYEVHEVQKNDVIIRGNKEIPYTYNVMVKSKNIHKSEPTRRKKSKTKSKSKSRSPSNGVKKNFVWFKRPKKTEITSMV